MFSVLSSGCTIERILFVTLSNIGDVVMTFPVFDRLHSRFPEARITVLSGPKARGFFSGHPAVGELVVYDKHASFAEKMRMVLALRRQSFQLAVDMRNSFLPFLSGAAASTVPEFVKTHDRHMKDKHLARLHRILPAMSGPVKKTALFVSAADRSALAALLPVKSGYVVVAPGAADDRKRWPSDRFAVVVERLLKDHGCTVVLVGDRRDGGNIAGMLSAFPAGVINLCGQTNLCQLAFVLSRASFALTNDSGIMHMASYLDVPVLVLFGPTDPFFYGPWGERSMFLRPGKTMQDIAAEDVLNVLGESFIPDMKSGGVYARI
jgi:ADP-heptose:LPS heptosyltransferase